MKVNGETKDFKENLRLADLLSELEISSNIVIELNGEIVKRDDWSEVILKDNDVIEIVSIVGGG